MTGDEKRFDIMMGVGAKYYPDPAFFIDEVLRLGLSKRVAQCPKWWSGNLWLVHWRTRKFFALMKGGRCREVTGDEAGEERGCGRPRAGKEYIRSPRRRG